MRNQRFEEQRFRDANSDWVRSFACDEVKCLVVCRGPVRKEAFEVFEAMGIADYGMLLSEKDSIVYPRCLAPELRSLSNPGNVHRLPDYMGVGAAEKHERIEEILEIARVHGYTHIFAGYGFMAEDAEFIEAIERAGIGFVGPSGKVVRQAGAKDEAKKLARKLGNAVIPGVDNISAQALLERAPDRTALEALATEHGLAFTFDATCDLAQNAEAVLQAGYTAKVELVSIPDLQTITQRVCADLWAEYPKHRIRFKHIGGGGGKGQRVVAEPAQVSSAIMDILAESKVLAPGSNRNFLIELNIETTRHNEIQLLGNGTWSISLGGRDCSVQMHEQKLLEVSLTRELLEAELARVGSPRKQTLTGDLETLERMELEAERFGEATGLDSASTFECVVDGFKHFFMEMNTRIQVEHGVTELVYRLRFSNPENPQDHFYVDHLIEAMVLLAVHGERLPRPERIPRHVSGIEVRINATNAALQPHAGGIIRAWSAPLPSEIRFDQGIGTPNPDTGSFIYYNLAGAYDSNVALILSHGQDRADNLQRIAEILRRTELRGDDLQTNLSLHYGMIQWMLGHSAMVKPTTRFMQGYLAAVGSLANVTADLDIDIAARRFESSLATPAARQVFDQKRTLLLRPLRKLLSDPHRLGGFIGRFGGELWQVHGGSIEFNDNPVRFLAELYHYLHMEASDGRPPSEIIWDHDDAILKAAMDFYADVRERVGDVDWKATQQLFEGSSDARICGADPELWNACVAAHRGFQAGLELLLLIPRIGVAAGFSDIRVNEAYEVVFPEKFTQPDALRDGIRALAPPPRASSNEIVTPMGGVFYAREAPHLPPLIQEGEHFEVGQPLFIIEVMKMFNKVTAPFSGRLVENLMAERDGTVVKKGQALFRIEPDERIEEETPEQIELRRTTLTESLLS